MHYKVLAITNEDPLNELRKYNEHAEEYYKWYSHHADQYFDTKEEAVAAESRCNKKVNFNAEDFVWEVNPEGYRDWGTVGGRWKYFFRNGKEKVSLIKGEDLQQTLDYKEFHGLYSEQDGILHLNNHEDVFDNAVEYGIKNNLTFFILDLHD